MLSDEVVKSIFNSYTTNTLKKFAVGYIDFFNNELKIEIIDAINWKEALSFHSNMQKKCEIKGDVSWLSNSIENAKFDAFNADFMFDVIEV